MSTPEDRTQAPAPPRSQLEGLGKRKKRQKPPKAPKPPKSGAAQRRAAKKAAAPPRQHPNAYKLIAAVALIVALDILLFFAIGYA
ncbi:MAG: hypothetical protein Q7T55_18375, partial [Solirubrobacteraceae bacterium]|nr:hypothetical protein [Solirubrobacteraceae bacterium]